MARTPRNELAVKDFANAVAVITSTHPPATAKEIELWIYSNHNRHVSEESIRKALRGDIDPDGCNLELLVGIRAFFAVPAEQLGRFAANRIEANLAMAGATLPDGPHHRPHDGSLDGPTTTGEQDISPTIWETSKVIALRPAAKRPAHRAA